MHARAGTLNPKYGCGQNAITSSPVKDRAGFILHKANRHPPSGAVGCHHLNSITASCCATSAFDLQRGILAADLELSFSRP